MTPGKLLEEKAWPKVTKLRYPPKVNVSTVRGGVPLCKLWLNLSPKVRDCRTHGSVTPRKRDTGKLWLNLKPKDNDCRILSSVTRTSQALVEPESDGS